jgi:hypothetical protein
MLAVFGEPDCVSRRRIPRHLFKCLASALRALAFIPLLFNLGYPRYQLSFRSPTEKCDSINMDRVYDGSSATLNAGTLQSGDMVVFKLLQ